MRPHGHNGRCINHRVFEERCNISVVIRLTLYSQELSYRDGHVSRGKLLIKANGPSRRLE